MPLRNLSPQAMFEQMAREHTPECRFEGGSHPDFAGWKQATLPRVQGTLGDFPARVEPNAELIGEWLHDGVRQQRWVLEVGPHICATLLVNFPARSTEEEKLPAILCWHGHGQFGKDPVMGDDSTPEMRSDIERMNYNYGHQMAKAGFVTFAIDWIGAGDRNDSRMHNGAHANKNQDWCNVFYLHATMLGMTSLSINIQHGRAATDFVCGLPGIDGSRLGVMGLSGGGTMALWSALCDERIRATEIICYSQLWRDFGFRDNNYCGMQVAPGLYKLVDLPDLQGLLAPRPLLVDIGAYDSGFRIESALACYHQVEQIYAAADARDSLEIDLFPGNHAWGGHKSVDFFSRWLS